MKHNFSPHGGTFKGGIDPNLDFDKISKEDFLAAQEEARQLREDIKISEENDKKFREWTEWNKNRKKGFFETIDYGFCCILAKPIDLLADLGDKVFLFKPLCIILLLLWLIITMPFSLLHIGFMLIDSKIHPERYTYNMFFIRHNIKIPKYPPSRM